MPFLLYSLRQRGGEKGLPHLKFPHHTVKYQESWSNTTNRSSISPPAPDSKELRAMPSRIHRLTTACLLMLLIVQLLASPARSALSAGPTPSSGGRSIVSHGSPPRPNAARLAEGLKHIGSIGGVVDTIAVTGTVALLGEGDSITVLDTHNPARPAFVTRRLLPALVRHIEIV